jgi:hypothetical protein
VSKTHGVLIACKSETDGDKPSVLFSGMRWLTSSQNVSEEGVGYDGHDRAPVGYIRRSVGDPDESESGAQQSATRCALRLKRIVD